jgi:putative addiction module antidote
MTKHITIRKVGNALGATMTEVVRELGLKEGDKLFVVRTQRGVELTPYDPEFAEAMEAAREFMRDNADVMRELAK